MRFTSSGEPANIGSATLTGDFSTNVFSVVGQCPLGGTNSIMVSFARIWNGVTNGATGPAGTNTVTVQTFTNSVLSSQQTTLLATNPFVFSGSNYLGSFSQMYAYSLNVPTVGGSGLTPGQPLNETMMVSTNAGSTWFAITNNFSTTNAVMLSVVGDSNSAPGSVFIYGVDHAELLGRTNSFFGQSYAFADPVFSTDPVTLHWLQSYPVSVLAPKIQLSSAWTLSTTNQSGTNHIYFDGFGQHAVDLADVVNYVLISSIALDASKTNILLGIYATNFVASSFIETCTNLTPPVVWQTVTNYTSVTNSGTITFTIPRALTVPVQFWRARGNAVNSFIVIPPITASAGVYHTSNTWSLFGITNTMANGGFWIGNSNGAALVSVQLSNGAAWIKQLAP